MYVWNHIKDNVAPLSFNLNHENQFTTDGGKQTLEYKSGITTIKKIYYYVPSFLKTVNISRRKI